jgi:ABC-type uncharacterized transport system substrate-binding protein
MKKLLLIAFCFVAVFGQQSGVFASDGKKIVLVIESYHKEFYWDAGYRRGITKVIGDQAIVKFFEMDTKRLPKATYPDRAALAISEIERVQPDIVMLGDDNALNFVGPEVIKKGIPTVFLGINGNPRDYFGGKLPRGITGVLERPALKRFLEFIRLSQRDWKELLILFDASNTSKLYKEESFFFQGKSRADYLGFGVEVYFSNSLEELKDKINAAQSTHDALFLGGLNSVTDETGRHVDFTEITKWVHENSQVPLFGFWRGTVGHEKTIGGYVADGQFIGEQAARLVVRILNGESPDDITVERTNDARLVLSRSSLKHWNIAIPDALTHDAEFVD